MSAIKLNNASHFYWEAVEKGRVVNAWLKRGTDDGGTGDCPYDRSAALARVRQMNYRARKKEKP